MMSKFLLSRLGIEKHLVKVFSLIEMKHKLNVSAAQSSGKGWLRIVKRVMSIAGSTAGILLAAPLRLPGKVVQAAQYIAIFSGIVKAAEKSGTDE